MILHKSQDNPLSRNYSTPAPPRKTTTFYSGISNLKRRLPPAFWVPNPSHLGGVLLNLWNCWRKSWKPMLLRSLFVSQLFPTSPLTDKNYNQVVNFNRFKHACSSNSWNHLPSLIEAKKTYQKPPLCLQPMPSMGLVYLPNLPTFTIDINHSWIGKSPVRPLDDPLNILQQCWTLSNRIGKNIPFIQVTLQKKDIRLEPSFVH